MYQVQRQLEVAMKKQIKTMTHRKANEAEANKRYQRKEDVCSNDMSRKMAMIRSRGQMS